MNTNKIDLIKAEVEKLHGNPYYMMAVKDVLAIIDSLQEEPVSEDLKKAADNALESISDQYDIISVGSCLEMFRLGAEWQMNKLPKWRRTPIKGGCWSGEIGVRPTARLFVYEHYSIKADKLFKLLNKED